MTPSTGTIPVTVMPEAADRIAELGLQAEVDRMIDYCSQRLPGVARIEIVLNERYETGDEPGVCVDVYSSSPDDPNNRAFWEMTRWTVSSFPAEVLQHLHISYYPGGVDHAG